MKIVTKELKPSQSSYEKNIAVWEIHFKKSLKQILLQYGIGLILLITGLYDYNSHSFSGGEYTTLNSGSTSSTINYDLHIMLAIGIVYIAMTSLNFFTLYRRKQKFFEKAAAYAIKYLQPPTIITIEANDLFLHYEMPYIKMEIKWEAFSNFMLYKNYVILNAFDQNDQSVLIDKRLITSAELAELTTFIRARIAEKK